jgi:hypothetical protein
MCQMLSSSGAALEIFSDRDKALTWLRRTAYEPERGTRCWGVCVPARTVGIDDESAGITAIRVQTQRCSVKVVLVGFTYGQHGCCLVVQAEHAPHKPLVLTIPVPFMHSPSPCWRFIAIEMRCVHRARDIEPFFPGVKFGAMAGPLIPQFDPKGAQPLKFLIHNGAVRLTL